MDYHELLAPHDFEPTDKSKRGEARKKKLIKLTKKQDDKKSKNHRKRKQKAQDLINERNYRHSPPKTSTFKRIEKHLKWKIEKALKGESVEIEDIDDPFVFAVMRKIIRQVVKNLEETLSWLREEYKRYLIPDLEIFSHKKWIVKNKKIRENLARKRNSKLLPLMNYLCNHKLSWKESESLAEELGADSHSMHTKKGQYVERTLVLVIPGYEDIENKLDMSLSLIRKYLQGMGDVGFIKPIKKSGSHGHMVYAVGYYLPYEGEGGTTRHRAIWFLKNCQEMSDALMYFYRPE